MTFILGLNRSKIDELVKVDAAYGTCYDAIKIPSTRISE